MTNINIDNLSMEISFPFMLAEDLSFGKITTEIFLSPVPIHGIHRMLPNTYSIIQSQVNSQYPEVPKLSIGFVATRTFNHNLNAYCEMIEMIYYIRAPWELVRNYRILEILK